MRQSEPPAAERFLHLLLDRLESAKERVRDITQRIDYVQVGGPAEQDEFHRVLQDAMAAGGIILERERMGRFTGEYARVRLTDADKLYPFLGRVPAAINAEAVGQTLSAAIPDVMTDPFFEQLRQEAIRAWATNKSVVGFGSTQVEDFATVLKLAHGIIHLAGRDVDHRTFSRRTAKDSKALERWEGSIAQLLRRYNPELNDDEPREVLEASGIVRRAHLLQVKGPVRLSSRGLTVEGTGLSFVGLPWADVQHASLSQSVDYIITIENATSFWRYCTEVSGNYLALLSDGFPARDVLSSMVHLVKVARSASDTPVFHWGDIDAGGVRIAAHLEDAFGTSVHLHQMTPGLADKLGSPLRSRKGLDRLAPRSGSIGELANWLRTRDAKALEQEELDPKAPMGTINDEESSITP